MHRLQPCLLSGFSAHFAAFHPHASTHRALARETPRLARSIASSRSQGRDGLRIVDVAACEWQRRFKAFPFPLQAPQGPSPPGCLKLSQNRRRAFAHLAQRDQVSTKPQPPQDAKKAPKSPTKAQSTPQDSTPGSKHNPGGKEQRLQDVQIIKRLLPNIWPKGDVSTKTRVLIALSLLVGGKVGRR